MLSAGESIYTTFSKAWETRKIKLSRPLLQAFWIAIDVDQGPKIHFPIVLSMAVSKIKESIRNERRKTL
jgi:hypothetical protein